MKSVLKTFFSAFLCMCITTAPISAAAAEENTSPPEQTKQVPTNEFGEPLTGKDLICYNTLEKYKKWGAKPVDAKYDEKNGSLGNAATAEKTISFGSGDHFWIRRYSFDTASEERFSDSIFVPGKNLEVRAYCYDTNSWFRTGNLQNALPKEILFIDTDSYHMILGVPAVYKKESLGCNTITVVPDQEQMPVITPQLTDGYRISWSYPQSPEYIGEIWCLESSNVLADWNNTDLFSLLHIDLANDRRLCIDGYYFQTPYNYTPGGENVLYRQPSNYTGASLISYSNVPVCYDLGYVTTYLCAQNQNEQGFWPTGPQSGWLYTDFGITSGFYDTRFNTDFASNLIAAYRLYYDEVFLRALMSYGDFFNIHAENNHYDTENGGWLVEDYGGQEGYRRTHCSLNHQLAEMNVLYKISYITGVKSYKQTADNMLKGIEDTRDQWVMPNCNLNYALYYSGSEELTDYPYLTYNDLYTTQQILNNYYHYTNETLDYLMKCKKIWMDTNNVTGYYTNQVVAN